MNKERTINFRCARQLLSGGGLTIFGPIIAVEGITAQYPEGLIAGLLMTIAGLKTLNLMSEENKVENNNNKLTQNSSNNIENL